MRVNRKSPQETMYLAAVAALYKDAGTAPKSARDQAYAEAMAAAYKSHPDDETKTSDRDSPPGCLKKSTRGIPSIRGCCNYLIHVYDDPGHAADGLKGGPCVREGGASRAAGVTEQDDGS